MNLTAARPMCFLYGLLLLLIVLPGCGSGIEKPEGLVPAAGTITVDGENLEQGSISLLGDDGQIVTGTIANGRFEIRYGQHAAGARPGNYQVGVSATSAGATMDAEGRPVEPESLIPEKFSNPKTSGLTLVVPEAGSDSLVVEVKTK